MKSRMISGPLLILIALLAMLVPLTAFGQGGRLYLATDQGVFLPATDQQLIRVTIGNPNLPPSPNDSRAPQTFVVQFDRPVDPVTIEPGKSFTYTLDPREVGVLVDQSTGLRHVRVSFRTTADVNGDGPAPQPALTIEIVNKRTGKLESFHAFPGFNGGIFVAAGNQ